MWDIVLRILTVGIAVAMVATMAALAPATTPSDGTKEETDLHLSYLFV